VRLGHLMWQTNNSVQKAVVRRRQGRQEAVGYEASCRVARAGRVGRLVGAVDIEGAGIVASGSGSTPRLPEEPTPTNSAGLQVDCQWPVLMALRDAEHALLAPRRLSDGFALIVRQLIGALPRTRPSGAQ
jgi:hypothetical protein